MQPIGSSREDPLQLLPLLLLLQLSVPITTTGDVNPTLLRTPEVVVVVLLLVVVVVVLQPLLSPDMSLRI